MKANTMKTVINAVIIVILMTLMQSCAEESLRLTGCNAYNVIYSLDNSTMEATATGYLLKNGDPLENVYLPDEVVAANLHYKVVAVDSHVFCDSQVFNVEFGSNFKFIGEEAYKGCREIRYVKFTSMTPPILPQNGFDQTTYEKATLIIPEDCNIHNTTWENFHKIVRIKKTSEEN